MNPFNAGLDYILLFIFYLHSKYPLLNMLKDLKIINLHFVQSYKFSFT